MSATDNNATAALVAAFESAAIAAGRAILAIRRKGADVALKADLSPVTQADREAEEIILAALAGACPGIPVIAEESVAAGLVPDIGTGTFILVDPLDGTREFIAGRDEFTVNIALIEAGIPVAGVVHAPALGLLYTGSAAGAFRCDLSGDCGQSRPIACRKGESAPVVVVTRSHGSPQTERFLKDCGAAEIRRLGSSLKFCLLAEGSADLYPRFSNCMEWDTAAGDAVLRAAGGITRDIECKPLRYGKTGRVGIADFANPHFIASTRP